MANPTTATLAYSAPLGGPTTNAQKQSAMEKVVLYNPGGTFPYTLPCTTDPVIDALYGSSVTADATAPSGGFMVRTIVITLGPGFFALFPDAADWAHAFDNLFTHTLALALAAQVKAAPVVFA